MDERTFDDFYWIECPGCQKIVIAARGKKVTNYHVACGTTYAVVKNSD